MNLLHHAEHDGGGGGGFFVGVRSAESSERSSAKAVCWRGGGGGCGGPACGSAFQPTRRAPAAPEAEFVRSAVLGGGGGGPARRFSSHGGMYAPRMDGAASTMACIVNREAYGCGRVCCAEDGHLPTVDYCQQVGVRNLNPVTDRH